MLRNNAFRRLRENMFIRIGNIANIQRYRTPGTRLAMDHLLTSQRIVIITCVCLVMLFREYIIVLSVLIQKWINNNPINQSSKHGILHLFFYFCGSYRVYVYNNVCGDTILPNVLTFFHIRRSDTDYTKWFRNDMDAMYAVIKSHEKKLQNVRNYSPSKTKRMRTKLVSVQRKWIIFTFTFWPQSMSNTLQSSSLGCVISAHVKLLHRLQRESFSIIIIISMEN